MNWSYCDKTLSLLLLSEKRVQQLICIKLHQFSYFLGTEQQGGYLHDCSSLTRSVFLKWVSQLSPLLGFILHCIAVLDALCGTGLEVVLSKTWHEHTVGYWILNAAVSLYRCTPLVLHKLFRKMQASYLHDTLTAIIHCMIQVHTFHKRKEKSFSY